MSELHSLLVNQEKLFASVIIVSGRPASSASHLSTTPSTESASISFLAVGGEHRSRSTTSDVLSLPSRSIKCRKILARVGGALSNVIARTGRSSSSLHCRRPQITVCGLAIQRDQPSLVAVRPSQREKEKPGAKVAHHFEHPRLNRCRPCQQHEMIIAGVSPLTVNTGVGFKSFAVQHPGQDAQRLYQIILLCAENGVKFSHDGRLKPDAWKKIAVAQFFAPNIGCVRHKRRCGEIVGGIG